MSALQVQTIAPSPGQAATAQIIMLHGWGANAQDLMPIAEVLQSSPLALPTLQFHFPQAPLPHPQAPQGWMWYDLETLQGIESSRQLLGEWLEQLPTSTGISWDRTVLAGFSQGGAMTLDLGLRFPLAGLISWSGYLHRSPQAGAQLPPILIVHGQYDPVVPLQSAQQARAQLQAIGAQVEYQEFPMGHEIQPAVLNLSLSFLQQVLPSAS